MKIELKRIIPLFLMLAAQFLLIPAWLSAQHTYPRDYFRSPVDFRILLSGTFGELRAGHFHSGMDIKTGGVSGKSIYAIADGYVSRIKVSATGFGKTLYVTHPNGFVSVYAHLSKFNSVIAPYVKARHYEQESFELNLYPGKGELSVKRGEVIAYSGNSGGSDGPHLHFEMRLESTQTPVNPLFFGFEVKDYIRPEIKYLKVIPASAETMINGRYEATVCQVDGWGEEHRVKNYDTISVSGPFSLAVNTYDKLNDVSNKNGVYSVKLLVDGEEYYYHDLEKFDFAESRYINSLIDYAEYVENKRRFQRSEIDPNNKLSIYKLALNEGIIHFNDTAIHHLEYVISDFQGNISKLPILIRSIASSHSESADFQVQGTLFSCKALNTFKAANFELSMPGSSIYRDLMFEYQVTEREEGMYSQVHHIHHKETPVHRAYTVIIRPDFIPAETDKLLLAMITDKGDYISYGGNWEDSVLKVSLRSFGNFTVLADTIPPVIKSVNIASGHIKSDRETVKVKIWDDLSGIKEYRASLNDQWLLMEYDAKNQLLIYYIDDLLLKGKNEFTVVVTDQRGNTSVFEKVLTRN